MEQRAARVMPVDSAVPAAMTANPAGKGAAGRDGCRPIDADSTDSPQRRATRSSPSGMPPRAAGVELTPLSTIVSFDAVFLTLW